MHLNTVPTEDTGIAESTYELVAGTDSESQDGNYTESISESVGSLDYHRPDDVVSLAGTEHTLDDESVVDIADVQAVPFRSAVGNDDNGDDASENESDSDNSSRESLEYADHSLQTPSILTPECSRFIEPPNWGIGRFFSKPMRLREFINESRTTNYLLQAAAAAIPGVLLAVVIALLKPSLYPSSETALVHVVSTVAPPLTQTSSLSSTLAGKTASELTSAPTAGVDLIPLQGWTANEWLFNSKPTVSFTPHGKNDVLIHVRQDVKDTWTSRDCLTVTVMRDAQKLDVTMSPVEDGILLQFPRWEAYGIVNLSVQATCRPKTQKEVKVHFGKGIIVEAFERTKNLAHDLSDLVPAAAHEAERRLIDMRRSLQAASQSFWQTVRSESKSAQKLLDGAELDMNKILATFSSKAWSMAVTASQRITTEASKASCNSKLLAMQTNLKIRLLDAQISARRWWLRVSDSEAAYTAYTQKAKEFLKKKREAASTLLSGNNKVRAREDCTGYRCASKRRSRD